LGVNPLARFANMSISITLNGVDVSKAMLLLH
jgi:hypothetical protein